MNENILVILLVVIIFALIVSIAVAIAILSRLIGHFNVMDHHCASIRVKLDRLVEFKDSERWKLLDRHISTCNRLDAIIGSLDETLKIVKTRDDVKKHLDDIHAVQCDTHKAVVEFKDRTANDIVKMRGELDSIFECLDRNHRELNLIFNDTHTMCKTQTQELKLKQKKRFKETGYGVPPKNDTEAYDIKGKPDDGGCRDCMFVFKPYYEEPCNKCSHGYGSQFVSRRNKE